MRCSGQIAAAGSTSSYLYMIIVSHIIPMNVDFGQFCIEADHILNVQKYGHKPCHRASRLQKRQKYSVTLCPECLYKMCFQEPDSDCLMFHIYTNACTSLLQTFGTVRVGFGPLLIYTKGQAVL